MKCKICNKEVWRNREYCYKHWLLYSSKQKLKKNLNKENENY